MGERERRDAPRNTTYLRAADDALYTMGYGFKGTQGRHNWRVATGRPEGRARAGSRRESIYQNGRYEARRLESARADRLDRERAHAARQQRLADERRRILAAEAKLLLDAAEAQRQEEERRQEEEERQLMVREDRPVPSTPSFGLDASAHVVFDVGVSPSGPWSNSGGPPQLVKTHAGSLAAKYDARWIEYFSARL